MHGGSAHPIPIVAGVAACVYALDLWRRLRRRRKVRTFVEAVTRRHLKTLSIKRRQMATDDGYGNLNLDAWRRHVDYFIGTVVEREAREARVPWPGLQPGTPAWSRLSARIDGAVARYLARPGPAPAPSDGLSGRDYELVCADILKRHGWAVSTTPATGDQGADLLAERAGRRVVLQCKFHGKPVGNKAVQEVFAALPFHGADMAVVVSNAAFTRSAQQLARTNGVLLTHHDRLPELADLCGAPNAVGA